VSFDSQLGFWQGLDTKKTVAPDHFWRSLLRAKDFASIDPGPRNILGLVLEDKVPWMLMDGEVTASSSDPPLVLSITNLTMETKAMEA